MSDAPKPPDPTTAGDLLLRWWVVITAVALFAYRGWQRWIAAPRHDLERVVAAVEQLREDIGHIGAEMAHLRESNVTVEAFENLVRRLDDLLIALATGKD